MRPPSALGAETKRFGRSAAVYLLGTLLVRGMTILLTPLYTRAMAPGDFAIVAIANAVGSVLAIVFGLSLPACIPRLSFEYSEKDRRAFFGTLLALSFVAPLGLVAILYGLGLHGDLEWFESVHFRPHLELVVWSSFCSVFLPLPLAVYTTREQPARASLLSATAAVLQLVFTVMFVVGLHQGALGVLRANLVSAALGAVLGASLMARMSSWNPSVWALRSALVFSLPLVPHLVANWALAISDRLILDRYVPAADVGRYALGYMFNVLVSVVAASIGTALQPMAYRQLKEPELARNVPPLGTYALLLMVTFGLGVALTAPEVIAIIAPPSYAGAKAIVPEVVLGAVFQGVYLVVSTGTWFSMRTRPVAVITLVCAGLNITYNLVFVPRLGVMAAAHATALAYAAAALLHGILAHSRHPIPWEFRRWALLAAAGLGWYFLGTWLSPVGLAAGLILKSAAAVVGFPLSLFALRFFSPEEIARARGACAALLGARQARSNTQ